MMASRFASGSGHGRQAHGRDYGREARGTRRRKAAASARVGPQGGLMDYLGSRDKRGRVSFMNPIGLKAQPIDDRSP
jgi:hypothetical protein